MTCLAWCKLSLAGIVYNNSFLPTYPYPNATLDYIVALDMWNTTSLYEFVQLLKKMLMMHGCCTSYQLICIDSYTPTWMSLTHGFKNLRAYFLSMSLGLVLRLRYIQAIIAFTLAAVALGGNGRPTLLIFFKLRSRPVSRLSLGFFLSKGHKYHVSGLLLG